MVPPALIQRIYGPHRVLSLHDLLTQIAERHIEAQSLLQTLVQPYDHTDYSQRLLNGTFCVLNAGAPPLRQGFTLRQESSMADVSQNLCNLQLLISAIWAADLLINHINGECRI